MAAFSLVVQATVLGLFVHQMTGYDVEKARKDLNILSGHDPVAMIAIGYPGDPDHFTGTLPDERISAARADTHFRVCV